MQLYLDIETRGQKKSFKGGVYRYVQDGAEPILFQWACDNGPVEYREPLWDTSAYNELKTLTDAAECVVIHNAEFDSVVLKHWGVHIPLEKQHCTMARAARHGLPGSLDHLCELYNLGADLAKIKDGKKLINFFCNPNRAGGWNDKLSHPEKWAEFIEYGRHDILAMRALCEMLPAGNNKIERRIWLMDQRTNRRGFQTDVELCQKMTAVVTEERAEAAARTSDLTMGCVEKPTQNARLLGWILAKYGVNLPDLQESTLLQRIQDEALPYELRELIDMRLSSAKASASKYNSALGAVCHDGRIRGTLLYCGARRTGRWSGKYLQPQNFARPFLSPEEVDTFIQLLKLGAHELVMDPNLSIGDYAKQCVRGVIVAAPGHRLIVADLANIEGRATAWLSGFLAKLHAFVAYDLGVGPDLYKLAYANAFGIAVEDVTKLMRQLGKVFELMLGYGGGVAAFLTGCETYRVDIGLMVKACWAQLDAELVKKARYAYERERGELGGLDERVYITCWVLTRMWRTANQPIYDMWYAIQNAMIHTIQSGEPTQAGKLAFDRPTPTWLRMRLPSGRFLMYAQPRVDVDRQNRPQMTFVGVSPYTYQWQRLKIWGGMALENASQAHCREVLAYAMCDAEDDDGFPVLSVHDEPVLEQPEGDGWTVDRLVGHLTKQRPWTCGLPIAASGFETQRYCKEV